LIEQTFYKTLYSCKLLKPIQVFRKRTLILLTILCLLSCNSTKQLTKGLSPEETNILLQSIINAEFGNQLERVKKWDQDLLVFLKNPEHEILVNEFEKIIQEINNLSGSISIKRVFDESKANYVIFFSNKDSYAKFEPRASKYLERNFGFFWLRWNRNFVIERGSMYVDVERIKDINCQKHILREELTQSLGIMNDHDGEEKSIFYQVWTCTTNYSELDKKIIRIFLDNKVMAGMTYQELKNYLNQ